MALSREDLAAISEVVREQIQATVPGIVDDRIRAIVPGIVDDRIDARVPGMIEEKLHHSENLILAEVDRVWEVAQENRREIKELREDVRVLKARNDIPDLYGLVNHLAGRMDRLEEKLTEHLEEQGA
ncbi:hypothetical protein MUB23_09075 [Cuneatibacter sp. NSJ-177]|uniref:hypothetical protein n=1 Tax=Cuneatibacter sp. NSJ-177 TaxID=2931401 RepID=UPI001FD46BAF|nr:hypothetical protein [Cuneatibacter sp. NSJ-177]MCJ7835543.1 hypothetical protein [Cuneatibacter sp. NSJ-177]